ncbi:MAG: hypothetical protein K2L02_04225 [Clostridia bacterium]|nr:hypothetical protein [Clostridia bacterium]
MATSAQQLNRFFQACDKLMNEKYMVADSRIEDVLRSIAESRALTDLFSAVTERFDYPSAKRLYLRFPASSTSFHGKAFLPEDRGEVLAFVFCLLVDIDAGRIKFDDFLLRYFYEDGSYTASFALFSDRMLRPFRDIVKECFPDVSQPVRDGSVAQKARIKNAAWETFTALAIEERARIKTLGLSSVDAIAGDMILSELIQAAGKNNLTAINALLSGYHYFLRALFLDGGKELIKASRELE